MKAADIISLWAATIYSDTSIAQPAQLMLPYCISELPAVDATKNLVGIVAEVHGLRRSESCTAHNAKPATLNGKGQAGQRVWRFMKRL
ncbi:hypothetical protein [Bradyrhizobium sp. CCBAU 51765]|uniref:hypothetical protein n=1 Tax=Bradyrhizobium sp. CCBAU 51765 TaxID=1325102 RepID=UPI0018870110|nr:hypothetical protein [Bradyrhizobium sp. CCBAU 51765]QOZ06703.1 hypothetical protein XH96_03575 [Bradyrhizobium sp. CCBAU 51765]